MRALLVPSESLRAAFPLPESQLRKTIPSARSHCVQARAMETHKAQWPPGSKSLELVGGHRVVHNFCVHLPKSVSPLHGLGFVHSPFPFQQHFDSEVINRSW